MPWHSVRRGVSEKLPRALSSLHRFFRFNGALTGDGLCAFF